MKKVINDYLVYSKKEMPHFGTDLSSDFNKKIASIKRMYTYLYEKGILKEVSFEYKDDGREVFFALYTDNLMPYKEKMLKSGVKDAQMAVELIFSEEYTPCLYCGSSMLSWTMLTYRDNSGCTGKSWECDLCQHINNRYLAPIINAKKENGARAAVSVAWDMFYKDEVKEA